MQKGSLTFRREAHSVHTLYQVCMKFSCYRAQQTENTHTQAGRFTFKVLPTRH